MDNFKYNDILNESAPGIRTRHRMPILDRAAQFSPFAAVVGHDAKVEETARITETRIELDEQAKNIINDKLQYVINMAKYKSVKITYFVPDERKAGGKYITQTGEICRIDDIKCLVIFEDKTKIRITDIIDVEII